MTQIKSVHTRPFRLPLKGSLSWGRGSRLDALEHVLVRVETDSGHVGVAEAPARPTIYGETPQSIEAIIGQHLAPKLVGLAVEDSQGIAVAINSVKNNQSARGALDIAICEARARTQTKSLLEAYRGQAKLQVSFILGIAELTDMVSEARSVFEAGVQVFKTKIGRDPQQDLAVIRALQHEFSGEPMTIYADANEGMNPKTAAQNIETLAELGVAYIEEPLPVHLIKARSQLKRDSVLPIIADDSCFNLKDLERELAFDTFDILNIKTARTGYTQSLQMLELAQTANKKVMFGSQAQSGLGTLHTAILASRVGGLPHELSFPLKLESDILDAPFPYRDGQLDLDALADHNLKEELA